jgi:hypothetical protein
VNDLSLENGQAPFRGFPLQPLGFKAGDLGSGYSHLSLWHNYLSTKILELRVGRIPTKPCSLFYFKFSGEEFKR